MKKKRILMIVIIGFLFCLDQIIRYSSADFNHAYCNAAGPWGIPVKNGVILALEISILLGFGYYVWKNRERAGLIASVFILVGGISNVVDRAVFGCVRDYQLFGWFPAFNLGDVSLTVGALILLYSWSFRVAETEEKE